MFDANDGGADDFPVTFPLGGILPSDLSPEDVSPMEYFEFVGSVDLNLVGDVWALDDGSVVAVAGLDKVDALVDVGVGIHDLL